MQGNKAVRSFRIFLRATTTKVPSTVVNSTPLARRFITKGDKAFLSVQNIPFPTQGDKAERLYRIFLRASTRKVPSAVVNSTLSGTPFYNKRRQDVFCPGSPKNIHFPTQGNKAKWSSCIFLRATTTKIPSAVVNSTPLARRFTTKGDKSFFVREEYPFSNARCQGRAVIPPFSPNIDYEGSLPLW